MKKKLQIRKSGAPVRQWVQRQVHPGTPADSSLDGGSPAPPLFRLVIPRALPSWNELYQGVHWATRKKLTDLWRELVLAEYIRHPQRPIPRDAYPLRLEVTVVFSGRRYDCSNLCVKVAEDPLIKRVIPNDSPRFVSEVLLRSVKGESDQTILEYHSANPEAIR